MPRPPRPRGDVVEAGDRTDAGSRRVRGFLRRSRCGTVVFVSGTRGRVPFEVGSPVLCGRGDVCLLLGGPSVAAASSLIQPDVNVPLPATHLSPSGARAALGSVAGRLHPATFSRTRRRSPSGRLRSWPIRSTWPSCRRGSGPSTSAPPRWSPGDTGVHDAEGVRMVFRDGQLWNHVSAQARYGLDNVNAYRATGDPAYLTRAEAQAQRLIDRHLDVDGAWSHPYDWVWDAMVPPWYSALGQGYALSLFTRLYELTGDATYKAAADGTLRELPRRGSGHDTLGLGCRSQRPSPGSRSTLGAASASSTATWSLPWGSTTTTVSPPIPAHWPSFRGPRPP